jgi:hypothetical protein
MKQMMHRAFNSPSIRGACLAILVCLAAGDRSPAGLLHSSQAQITRPLAPVGPLGHWKCDDGQPPTAATDSSGNGFHGTYSAGATTSTAVPTTKFPNPGCLNLDGATGVVSVPDNPALRITGDITIAFWKRKTAIVKDWVRLVGKGNGGQRTFGVWEFPEAEGRIKFQIYNAGNASVLDLDSSTVTAINTWAHIVCVISVNSAAMYINGALVANGTRNGEPASTADPLTFGWAGYHGYFPGQLDDIRIYDRALSMSEIVYLATGNGGPDAHAALATAGAGPQKVMLKWTASATPAPAGTATYYIVKRSATAGSGYKLVANLLTATTYTDTTADPAATSYYVVTAVNTGGESVPSNELTVAPHPK